MRLSTSFEVLTDTIGKVASVVDDSMSSEELRNIIFSVSENELKLIGVSQLITYRKRIELGDFRVQFDETDAPKISADGYYYFQLNSKELTGFLNTFKSMKRTKPSDVIFEPKKGDLIMSVTVVEDSLDDAEVKNHSTWDFDNVSINKRIFTEMSKPLPADDANWSMVQTKAILYYTANMLPIMAADGGGTLYNILTFGEDFVVGFNQRFNTLMKNVLPDEFKGISLNYRAILFMKNVICDSEMISVSKVENQLVFKTDDSEAFINFLTKMPAYRSFVESYREDNGIAIDRQYFKDVLKRLSLVNESITFSISPEKDTISVSNKKFHQEIPILVKKEMDALGEVKLKVGPQVFQQAIIGDDSQFAPETFLYFVKGEHGGYTTIFTDSSKQWISLAVLR